ncbi:immunoglobulin-like domain-containing protein [Haloplasma contractile]|uniref:Chitinase protein n=1 Tax=Haloplasma contractile SSD-17B TaxID=1033810 RepID=F7PX01_9MOLU|nr:immunoglobulin-like domain-containing protein [Haloplasma contractile]ERJ12760.1 chitinase protein [Haloplasma contractile SSD-17B]
MKKLMSIMLLAVLLFSSLITEVFASETNQTTSATEETVVSSSEYIRIARKEIEVGTHLSDVSLDVEILKLENKQFTLDFDYSKLNLDVVGDYTVYTNTKFKDGPSETLKTIISVVDSVPPTIVLEENRLIIEVNSVTPDWSSYVGVSDNYYGLNELDIEINKNGVDINQLGTYNIDITVSDPSNNESTASITVEVRDTTSPFISKNKPITIEVLSNLDEINWSDYIEFDDNYDEVLNQTVDTEAINLEQLGAYLVLFTVTDSSGNEIIHQETVHIVDTIKPIINGTNDVDIDQGKPFDPLEGITATDQYDGDLTSRLKVVSDYDVNKVGKQEIKLEVSDSSGNKSIITYQLTVNRTLITKDSIRYVLIGGLVLTAVVLILRKRIHSNRK